MPTPQLSVQLYSVRDALAEDLEGTLDRIAGLGFTNVETFGFMGDAARLRTAYDAAGLKAPSGHASFLSDQLEPGAPKQEMTPFQQVLDEAATLGIEVLIDPFVARPFWLDTGHIARTADRLNGFVEIAEKHGIRLGYHNHSHEFHHNFDPLSAYEAFVAQLDPRIVLEVDVFWAAISGQDVEALLERLGDQVRLIHAKDGIIGPDPFLPDAGDVKLDQRPAGQGDLDMAAILAAAPATEYAVVEFDHFNGDLFEAIGASAAHLLSLGVEA